MEDQERNEKRALSQYVRATQPEAVLTVSDWVRQAGSGGPTGQKLVFNFIQIEPFFED